MCHLFFYYLICFCFIPFSDGLLDCMDPDCCASPECASNMFCHAPYDPAEILLRKQAPSTTASFYEKMKFLVEEDSVQMDTSKSAFNERYGFVSLYFFTLSHCNITSKEHTK